MNKDVHRFKYIRNHRICWHFVESFQDDMESDGRGGGVEGGGGAYVRRRGQLMTNGLRSDPKKDTLSSKPSTSLTYCGSSKDLQRN